MSLNKDNKNKNYSISVLNRYLEKFKKINNKQFFNLLKWMIRLTRFTINDISNPSKTRFPKFAQGDIVKVDFGFNIGRELGGVHYAVVISNNDSPYSATIIVAPLTSIKVNSKINKWEINLETEFYDVLHHSYQATERDVNRFLLYKKILNNELQSFYSEFKESYCDFAKDESISKYNEIHLFLVLSGSPKDKKDSLFCYKELIEIYNRLKSTYQKIFESNAALKLELSFLKKSSKLKVDQIRCISKLRITNPRNATDALNGVRLLPITVSKIVNQIISNVCV